MTPSILPKLCLPAMCLRPWEASCDASCIDESEHVGYVYDLEASQELGAGGFGIVRKAAKKVTHQVHAIKSTSKGDCTSAACARNEINILGRLHHPCICPLIDTFEDQTYFHIVLEFIDGQDLFKEMSEKRVLDEARSIGIMQQVFSALEHCHRQRVIHRDVKPENIMVHRSQCRSDLADTKVPMVKLVDFGLAAWYSESDQDTSRTCLMGCSDYLSPEAKSGCAMPASDVFSAGVVLCLLLTGHFPSRVEIERGGSLVEGTAWTAISSSSRDLLRRVLKFDPNERMTAEDVAAQMSKAAITQLRPKRKIQENLCKSAAHSCKELQASALIAISAVLATRLYDEHNWIVINAFVELVIAGASLHSTWTKSKDWRSCMMHGGAMHKPVRLK